MEEPDTNLSAQAADLGCASLVDAMGRIHQHRSHILSLVSPTPQRPVFGPAVTIQYLPYRDDFEEVNTLGFGGWFYRAIGKSPAGKVLVLSSGGYPDASHGGGTKMSRLHNNGLAGVVTDGRLRDFGELANYRFGTWCAGEATRWGGDTVAPCAADVPVEVGGVCITPGDFVYADQTGGVVIPAASVDDVFAEARRVDAEDQKALREIRTENPASVTHSQ